jgi:D-3-phosphoglycerate dehydrogenase
MSKFMENRLHRSSFVFIRIKVNYKQAACLVFVNFLTSFIINILTPHCLAAIPFVRCNFIFMQVLFADENHPVLVEKLREAGHQCDLFWNLAVPELIRLLPGYDALVIRSRFRLTAEILQSAARLKCIGRVGAGMENIDVEFAKKKQIQCLSVPEGNRDAVGEHATGTLLMLLRNLKRADSEVRNGIWKRAENRGKEIGEMTVCLIGYGNTGNSFAKKLSGFGCKVLAYDKYLDRFENNFAEKVSMDQIFKEADVLSLHIPLTEETKYLVDRDFISRFNKNFYFINTSRGPCVNTADLVQALESGKICGACLDVLEYEDVSFENVAEKENPEPMKYLINSDKVILTPHIAGWTHDSNYKMSKMIAEKMIAALKSDGVNR